MKYSKNKSKIYNRTWILVDDRVEDINIMYVKRELGNVKRNRSNRDLK